MRITSHDVARRAGVSQPTVSRALRDQRGVSSSTRKKVRDAAEELGYIPLQSGRALSTARSRRIGIVTDELTNPFYPALIGPLHRALSIAGYRTILLTDTRDSFDLEPILDGSLDGVLLTSCRLDSAIPDDLFRRGIPFMMVNREVPGARGDASVPDNAAGAALVADLLVELGHRDIGVLMGPSDTSTGRERTDAFRDQLSRHQIALHPDLMIESQFSVEDGAQAMEQLARVGPVTAVFCANDVLAIGALNHARTHRVRVPDDLTIVGFDDIAMTGYPTIDLTTVHIDHEELALKAVDRLLARIGTHDAETVREVIAPRLVRRGSHGPPTV